MEFDKELARAAAAEPIYDLGDPALIRQRIKKFSMLVNMMPRVKVLEREVEIAERQIPGASGSMDIPARLYRVPAARTPGPCVLFFHGGGYVTGDLDTEHARCLEIAKGTGFLVVSIEYRLAPEHQFPAAVDDCYQSLVWLQASSRELAVDLDRVAVCGPSCGGGLAAAVALMTRDRSGPKVLFQMLLYPALDDRLESPSMLCFVDTPRWNRANTQQMWNHYLGKHRTAVSIYAAPARASQLEGLPSAYIMTAEMDPLRDEGIEYASRLLAAGVSAEVHQYPGAYHGFDTLASPLISRRARGEQVAVLQRALANREIDWA